MESPAAPEGAAAGTNRVAVASWIVALIAAPVGLALGVVGVLRARRVGAGMAHAVVGVTLGAVGTAAGVLALAVTAGLLLAPAVTASPPDPTDLAAPAAPEAPTPSDAASPQPVPAAPAPAQPAPLVSAAGRDSEAVTSQAEQDFIDFLYEDTYQAYPDAELIGRAWEVCEIFASGGGADTAQDHLYGVSGMTSDRAYDIAYEAEHVLCPSDLVVEKPPTFTDDSGCVNIDYGTGTDAVLNPMTECQAEEYLPAGQVKAEMHPQMWWAFYQCLLNSPRSDHDTCQTGISAT